MNTFCRLVLLLMCTTVFAGDIENSITPLLNSQRQLKNIDAKKYCKSQYQAIDDALKQKASIIRVASFNMLFDRYDHLLAPNYHWKERVKRVAELIDEMHADIICFQELFPKQIAELMDEIDDEYFLAGPMPCPDDDPEEVNGIFIRKGRFQCKEVHTHYISDTPTKPSSDPFSGEQMTLFEAHLTDWVSGKELAVLSTHISFGSPDSREYAAKFITNLVEPLCKKKAVIVGANCNSFAARLDEPTLPFFDGNYILKILTSRSLRNAKDAALIGTLGPLSTYTNKPGTLMPFQATGTPGVYLDHLFVGGSLAVLVHAIQPATVGGLYASSHMPVVCDVIN